MALVPLSYNARSLFVRRSSTLLTIASIAATVAVVAGVLALDRGFTQLFEAHGREDVAVVLRPGAPAEGQSAFDRERADVLIKESPEFVQDGEAGPLASAETYRAVRLRKLDGGETNVPIRGVMQRSLDIRADELALVEGRAFAPGADEVIVGRPLTSRIQGCAVGDVIVLNTTSFRVVGVFEHDGPFSSEIWGDIDRIGAALDLRNYSRVIGVLKEGKTAADLHRRLETSQRVPADAKSEREYLAGQTAALSITLTFLGWFLGLVMGTAAIFTGTNTMLAALAARSHEIGVLLSLGFRPVAVFASFLAEAVLLGFLGGLVGCAIVIPLHGVETGTTNWATFTEVAFAFRLTPDVLATAVVFAIGLGLVGGAWPAWRAARLDPSEAMRRG